MACNKVGLTLCFEEKENHSSHRLSWTNVKEAKARPIKSISGVLKCVYPWKESNDL